MARPANLWTRHWVADGLSSEPAVRNSAKQTHRFRNDAAPAPIRPLLGSGRQQRKLCRDHAVDLEHNGVVLRRFPALERLALCEAGPPIWHRPAAPGGVVV